MSSSPCVEGAVQIVSKRVEGSASVMVCGEVLVWRWMWVSRSCDVQMFGQ